MKKGFTLIELLVVVIIIGILAAIAIPQYMTAVEKSRATEALNMIPVIRGAMDRYLVSNRLNDFTKCPTDITKFDVTLPLAEKTPSTTKSVYNSNDFLYTFTAKGCVVTIQRVDNPANATTPVLYTFTFYATGAAPDGTADPACKIGTNKTICGSLGF